MNIKRGDIYLVDLGKGEPGSHVQKYKRPVIVISNDKSNTFSHICNVIPLTTNCNKNIPSHVIIQGYGLRERSAAMVEQLTTLDQSAIRTENKIGTIDNKSVLDTLLEAIMAQAG